MLTLCSLKGNRLEHFQGKKGLELCSEITKFKGEDL